MACRAEQVTAYVDRELSPRLEREVERHLYGCPVCAAQAVFEIELCESLHDLTETRFRAGLSDRILAAALADVRLNAH